MTTMPLPLAGFDEDMWELELTESQAEYCEGLILVNDYSCSSDDLSSWARVRSLSSVMSLYLFIFAEKSFSGVECVQKSCRNSSRWKTLESLLLVRVTKCIVSL